MDRLNQMGVDLGEALDKNPDGTMWAYAVVTAAQRDYLAKLGFRPGYDHPDRGRRREGAGRDGRHRAHGACTRCASRRPDAPRRLEARRAAGHETIKVTRADYYQSSSGTWLSVEAKSSAAQGNAAVPPGQPGCPTTGSNRCGVYGGSTTGACWGNPAGGASALSTAACPVINVAYSTDNGQTWRQRLPDADVARHRRRRLPLPLPARQAGAQGERRHGAAPADARPRRVELRDDRRRGRDGVRRHAAAVPVRLPARLLRRGTRRPRTARR